VTVRWQDPLEYETPQDAQDVQLPGEHVELNDETH
jgi:hypothetical protein